ncbi:hypothetical protein RQP46_005244 [Phenoliferia psychrophenolica]
MSRLSRFRSGTASQLAFLSPALVGDWAVVIALSFVSSWIERQYPYERDVRHQLMDGRISWPHSDGERVPVPMLYQLAFWLPFSLLLAISLVLRQSLHDAHHALLALFTSGALMRVTVEFVKNRVGRLRPDFIARCMWDPVEEVCRGGFATVKDGRRSFPSGHSATAFQGLFVLALFVAGKNEDHRHHVEDVLAGSTIGILSALVGYSMYFPIEDTSH